MPIQSQAYLDNELTTDVRSGGVGGLTTAAQVRQLLQDIIDTLFGGDATNATNLATLSSAVVLLAGGQTVTGTLTFDELPVSTEAPTTGSQLTNKTYVDGAIATAVEAIPAGGAFDSSSAIKRQIPGMQGVVLGGTTVVEALQAFFYPVQTPLITALSIPSPYHEYGDSGAIPVSWTVTKTDQPIDLITVAGIDVTPTGNTQSGSTNVNGGAMGSTQITVVASSDGSSTSETITSQISKKVRIGGSAHDGIVLAITDADIDGLQGFFVPGSLGGFEEDVAVGAGNYLVIEIPTSFGIPLIFIDGTRFTAFNQIRAVANYTNPFGYTDSVNVYASLIPMPGTFTIQFE